ncbi:hypothetical protein ACS0TY_023412 [Phlomoides rotata]
MLVSSFLYLLTFANSTGSKYDTITSTKRSQQSWISPRRTYMILRTTLFHCSSHDSRESSLTLGSPQHESHC